MSNEFLSHGKRKDNGEWIEGYVVHQTDFYGDKVDRYFIIDGTETEDYNIGPAYEVIPETIGRCSGRCDISGTLMYEGDIFEAHLGTQILAATMILRYGVYQAYCPADKTFMDSVGFYVEAEGYPNMPVGDTESYAKIIGNINDNMDKDNGARRNKNG